MAHEKPADGWRLDRNVSLPLVVVVVGQFITGIWWSATLSKRVDFAELQLEQLQKAVAPLNDRTVRLDEKVDGLRQSIAELKQLLMSSRDSSLPAVRR